MGNFRSIWSSCGLSKSRAWLSCLGRAVEDLCSLLDHLRRTAGDRGLEVEIKTWFSELVGQIVSPGKSDSVGACRNAGKAGVFEATALETRGRNVTTLSLAEGLGFK